MSCTSEEIAEKRKKALEILNAKRLNSVSPTKSTTSFYGKLTKDENLNTTVQYIPSSSSFNGIMKNKNPYQSSRILSQPYPKESPNEKQNNSNNSNSSILAPVFRKTVTCICSMVSEDRFTVTPSAFHSKLIEVFKSISSKSYDPKTKEWTFHKSEYDVVQERVGNLNPDVTIGGIPKNIFKILSEPNPISTESCLNSIEPELLKTLMPFQKEGVMFGIQKKGRCLIADEMGLGKTYQALALADFYKDDFPLLVCTTASTRNVWLNKVRTLLPYIPCHYIVSLTSTNDYFGDAKVLIVSYALMEKNIDKIMQKKFGILIMDESHILKNFKAKCTTVALQLTKHAKRVILLSGTPALSRPVELFTQLQLIDRSFLGFKEYTLRYCEGKQTNFGWDANGQANLAELNLILSKKFMIRRTKEDVLTELAEKSRETVILDSTLIGSTKDEIENLRILASSFSESKGREREELLLRYYSETAAFKTKAVCAYIKGLIKEKKKFLVFAHHMVMLNAITDCLKKLRIDFIRIDGSTKNDVRASNVEHFQNDERCKVAVLSIKACNTGITLTAAQLVIFAELDWNPSTLSQAESRAHRIGQEGKVTVRYLLATNTVDDVIWKMLKNKQNVLTKAGLCNEDFSDATFTVAPSTENKIENYFENTTKKESKIDIKEEVVENDQSHCSSTTTFCDDGDNIPTKPEQNTMKTFKKETVESDYLALLDDDNDDDLANLIF